jgi:hydrogenase/urease accessory protein HupE
MHWLFAPLLAALTLFADGACAHEVRPAYLEITEPAHGSYTIVWKQPVVGDMALHLIPHLSNGWLDKAPTAVDATPFYLLKVWRVRSDIRSPLESQTLRVEGLDRSITDVLVRVNVEGQRPLQALVQPADPELVLSFTSSGGLRLPAYFVLGIEHILTGADHLCFVLGLMLLVGINWQLLKAVTAFTVAHSITLGLAALGYVHLPSAVIESLVAMSILFLAVELVRARRGEQSLTVRLPWLIAFTFGLLHGLAFAGALAEVGLPPHEIPLALFLFNVGVETGQILFIMAAAAVVWTVRQLSAGAPRWWREWRGELAPYAIGTFAAFWFIERLAVILA